MVSANRTSISQQSAGACFDQAFISYVRENETFNTDKARAAGECNRESARVGASKHLDAKRQRCRPSYFRADDGHRGCDLRTDAGFQVRAIICVLNHDTLESGILVFAGFLNSDRRNGRDVEVASGCARQSPKVNDTYERPSDAEQRVDDAKLVQGNSLLLFLMVHGRLTRDCC